jgi:putative hydrolase of the HAD superfamily
MGRWPVIGFDADDTLWHNEVIFERVHGRYRELLGRYHDGATVERTLFATEMRNLPLYGYGIKGFALSAIETAIELTKGEIRAEEIRLLIAMAKEMMEHPVEVLDGVPDVLRALAPDHRFLLITKGDLRDQERKLARSGLADFFDAVEIVSEKNRASYERVLRRHGVAPADFVMVGNSVKSDILPVLELGGSGVHIPYPLLWEHERAEQRPDAPGRYFELPSIRELPALAAGVVRS